MAGRLVGQAARTGYGLARRLPGAETAERELHRLERAALTELGKRIDDVTDPYLAALRRPSFAGGDGWNGSGGGQRGDGLPVSSAEAAGELQPLRAAMAELLERSISYGPEQAREYCYAIVLRQLAPDEARMLSALSDGSPFPVVHIAERSGVGGTGRYLLRNASSLGKAAGVTLPDEVPHYISRLCALDLAELTEESVSLQTQYEILLAEEQVRVAQEAAKRPKVMRNTLRISTFGTRFWQACDPTAQPGASWSRTVPVPGSGA
ncbi:DUF4393 domain-containing protein [Haloechinothrix sp. LS1_15]|nr:DUF4393 domain-containing protein [Haloechinothrix sp. LS1_15]